MRSRRQTIAIILSYLQRKHGKQFGARSTSGKSAADRRNEQALPARPSTMTDAQRATQIEQHAADVRALDREPSAHFQSKTKDITEADWDHFSKELRAQAEEAALDVLSRIGNKRYYPQAIITGEGESDQGLAVTIFDNPAHRGVMVLHESRWNDKSDEGGIIGTRLAQHEGWSVGDSIKDVIAHEIGHSIHWRLASMHPALFKKIMKEQFGKDHQRVSDYAKESEYEAFAETFSAIFTDVKPLKPHIIAAAKKLEDTLIQYKVLSPRTGTKTEAMKKAPLKLTPGMKKKLAVHRAAMANAQELADMTGDEE